MFIHLSKYMFNHPHIRPSIKYLLIYTSIHLLIHPSIHPFKYPSNHPNKYLSISSFIQVSVHPFIHSNVCSCIHPSIHRYSSTSFLSSYFYMFKKSNEISGSFGSGTVCNFHTINVEEPSFFPLSQIWSPMVVQLTKQEINSFFPTFWEFSDSKRSRIAGFCFYRHC